MLDKVLRASLIECDKRLTSNDGSWGRGRGSLEETHQLEAFALFDRESTSSASDASPMGARPAGPSGGLDILEHLPKNRRGRVEVRPVDTFDNRNEGVSGGHRC